MPGFTVLGESAATRGYAGTPGVEAARGCAGAPAVEGAIGVSGGAAAEVALRDAGAGGRARRATGSSQRCDQKYLQGEDMTVR